MTPVPDDDADLGRLLAEGLGRAFAAPVDERELLDGARRGAVRIRRRRQTALGVAVTLVVAVPVVVLSPGVLRTTGVTTAGGAADSASSVASGMATSAAAPAAGSGSGGASGGGGGSGGNELQKAAGVSPTALPSAVDGGLAVPVPSSAQPASSSMALRSSQSVRSTQSSLLTPSTQSTLARTSSGEVIVPDGLLPVPGDLPQVVLRRTSDTANNTPAGAMAASDTCGTTLTGRPAAVGGRSVALERRTGATATSWLLGGTVRVFARDGAVRYLAAAGRLACAAPVVVSGAEAGYVGHGGVDGEGRTHWYGVVRTGGVVSELRLVVPRGGAAGEADVVRVLRLSAQRARESGLPAAVAGDPALR